MKKRKTLLTEFWAIIHIASELNFCKNLKNLFFKKNINTWLAQFWIMIYVTSEFNLVKKSNTLLVQIWTLI